MPYSTHRVLVAYLLGLATAVGVYCAVQLYADHVLLGRVIQFLEHAQ